MSDDSHEATGEARRSSRDRLWHRIALIQAVILLTAVIFALPIAFRSMGIQLTERQARTLYDFPSGEPATADVESAVADKETFLNIAVIDLDVGTGSVTLALSGHRTCPGECAPISLTLVSVDDNADVRRALPPAVALDLDPSQPYFNQTVQLPIRGQPSQYPFDDYVLWLGLIGTVSLDNVTLPLTNELLVGHAVITTQNQLRDFQMAPPTPIDPDRVQAINDPLDFVGVQELHFERPIHLGILAVLLITLIAASAVGAVIMRDLSDLIVGIGSLVLGIWGVRSILVPQPLPVVSAIDLALSVLILFVLLGLSIRAATHYRKTAELPALKIRGKERR